jgi:hypothetical protein
MSADTNNISGIRGVLPQRETLITVNFFLRCKAAQFSRPLRRRLPRRCLPRCLRCLRQRHAAGGVPVVVPDPIAVPDLIAPSLQRSVLSSLTPLHHHRACGAAPLHQWSQPLFQGWSRSISGFHWLIVATFWKMQGGSFFRGYTKLCKGLVIILLLVHLLV